MPLTDWASDGNRGRESPRCLSGHDSQSRPDHTARNGKGRRPAWATTGLVQPPGPVKARLYRVPVSCRIGNVNHWDGRRCCNATAKRTRQGTRVLTCLSATPARFGPPKAEGSLVMASENPHQDVWPGAFDLPDGQEPLVRQLTKAEVDGRSAQMLPRRESSSRRMNSVCPETAGCFLGWMRQSRLAPIIACVLATLWWLGGLRQEPGGWVFLHYSALGAAAWFLCEFPADNGPNFASDEFGTWSLPWPCFCSTATSIAISRFGQGSIGDGISHPWNWMEAGPLTAICRTAQGLHFEIPAGVGAVRSTGATCPVMKGKHLPNWSAEGPMTATNTPHGCWTEIAGMYDKENDCQVTHPWYWYGEKVTEGEWHLRSRK